MSVPPERGLDGHEWETEMAMLEEDLRTRPTEAMAELVDLVERMLLASGYRPDDATSGRDPEIVGEFGQARASVAALASGEDGELGDAGDAVQRLMRIYDYLLREHRAP